MNFVPKPARNYHKFTWCQSFWVWLSSSQGKSSSNSKNNSCTIVLTCKHALNSAAWKNLTKKSKPTIKTLWNNWHHRPKQWWQEARSGYETLPYNFRISLPIKYQPFTRAGSQDRPRTLIGKTKTEASKPRCRNSNIKGIRYILTKQSFPTPWINKLTKMAILLTSQYNQIELWTI